MWLLPWLVGIASAGVPVDAGVRVLVRVLSYDRELATRAGDVVRIGIVYDRSDHLSATQAREVSDVITGMGVTVAGLPLATPVLLDTAGPWGERLDGLSVVIVCRGAPLGTLVSEAAERDLRILALDATAVGQGAAVGVELRSAHLQIVVDLVVARDQGMALSTEVLQLSRILGRAPN